MMKDARVAGTSPTTRQRWRVPFSIRTSPGDSNTSAPSSSSSHVAGEKDPEIRRVGRVKAVVCSTGFVAILEVHLGSGFWRNHTGQVRPYDVADAAYGWEYTGGRRIVPRVRVGCGLIGIPEKGELSQARNGRPIDFLVLHKNSPTLGVMAGDNRAHLHSLSLLVGIVHGHVLGFRFHF